MEDYRKQACAQGLPCALHDYLYWTYGDDAEASSGILSKDESLTAFKFWVDNIRAHQSTTSKREPLMCPMLWCRLNFKDPQDTVDHISTCRWLSDTRYWCLRCSRPETFTGVEVTGIKVPTYSLQRKESRLRKAATFFKHFGRLSSAKSRLAWPESPPKATEIARTSSRPAECDGTAKWHEMQDSYSVEMSTRLSHTLQHELPPSKSRCLPVPPPYAELPSDFSQIARHDGARRTMYYELSGNPYSDVSTLGVEVPNTSPNESLKATRDSDNPDTDYPSTVPQVSAPSLSFQESSGFDGQASLAPQAFSRNSNCTKPTKSRPKPMCWLSENRQDLWKAMISSAQQAGDHDSFRNHPWGDPFSRDGPTNHWMTSARHYQTPYSERDLTPMQRPLQELREVISTVYEEWTHRLSEWPESLSSFREISLDTVCELGLDALQQMFSGKLVESLVDTVALIHVALATSYILHKDDNSYCWEVLVQDIIQWRHAIPEESDVITFLEVIDKLWIPSKQPVLLSANESAYLPCNTTRLDMLKHGRLVRNCSDFLDSLDYCLIPERNDQLLAAHLATVARDHNDNIEKMISQITQPLQEKDGLEAFRPSVIDTEFLLRSGLLHNPHEVEVTLISSAKRCSRSPRLYEDFRESVKTLLNQALRQPSGSWRDPWYATGFNRIMAILLEINKPRKSHPLSSTKNLRPKLDLRDLVELHRGNSESSTLDQVTRTGENIDLSPAVTVPSSSVQSDPMSGVESTLTSPTSIHTESGNSSASPPAVSDVHETRCRCGERFHGNSKATNLQRHLRFAKIHNKSATFVCEWPGCGAQFNRSDNRNYHVRTTHKSPPQAEITVAARRSWSMDDEVDVDYVTADFV